MLWFKKQTSTRILFFVLSLGMSQDAVAAAPPVSRSSGACTGSESWNFSAQIPAESATYYKRFLSKSLSVVGSFAEGLALRRLANSEESRLFSEYWISRSLLQAGMVHVAYEGFKAIASQPVSESNVGVHSAALTCLVRVHYQYPTFQIPSSTSEQIAGYALLPQATPFLPAAWEAAGMYLRDQVAYGKEGEELQRVVALLKNGGVHEDLGKGFAAARNQDHAGAIQAFERFLSQPQNIPKSLQRYIDLSRMLLARSYYARKNYVEAIKQFKLINKDSNELAEALTEMAWAYLLNGQYREAIGTAINLQSGGLRNTFSPEAPVVMAMALNELCHFPKSIRGIGVFKKNYKKPYFWIKDWLVKNKDKTGNLYVQAVQYLKDQSNVPDRVASEWVKSPNFISRQEEINLLFDEGKSSNSVGRLGQTEQLKLTRELLRFIVDVKKRFQLAKIRLKPGQRLPSDLNNDLEKLRVMVNHYRHLQAAAPLFSRITQQFEPRIEVIRKQLMDEINRELKAVNIQMYRRIKSVAENSYFVEVEIFSGASKDIIWQNSHPDYEEVAEDLKDKNKKAKVGQVWDWGNVMDGFEGSAEIWEDELGSFKADLYDNCVSKDQYLALKREAAPKKLIKVNQ